MSDLHDPMLERAALALEQSLTDTARGPSATKEIPADLERRLVDLVAGDAMARAMIVLESETTIPPDLEARLVDVALGETEPAAKAEPLRARRWRTPALAFGFAILATLAALWVVTKGTSKPPLVAQPDSSSAARRARSEAEPSPALLATTSPIELDATKIVQRLLPRAQAGTASEGELRLLRAACRQLGDKCFVLADSQLKALEAASDRHGPRK